MIDYDFHTHTTFSHGSGSILDNALAAKQKGLKGIAIADHGFSHPAFGMRRKYLKQMKMECEQAQKQTGVEVFLGIESNLLGLSGKTDLKVEDYSYIDVFLAGIHRFVILDRASDYFKFFGSNFFTSVLKLSPSDKLVKNTTAAYINAIKNNPIDILTHLNFCCYANSLEVAKCLEDYGTYLEINTKKVHLTDEEWQNIVDKTNVNFVIDSDAHSPDRVGDCSLYSDLLSRISIPNKRIHNLCGNKPNLRFSAFKEKNL
ncbi:MAG: PHP domain-containing protein [Clostridia bacterium]|nr:PHP domain-containing protein [Clostridia bacterium]